MKTRNIVIIVCLIIVGIALYGGVRNMTTPQTSQSKKPNTAVRLDPLTQDFQSIVKYKNKYMGNAVNLANLFHSLPLNDIEMTFQLHPDTQTAEVTYNTTVADIGEDKLDRDLIYNATAAFSLIDNLKALKFNFEGSFYTALRGDFEEWYSTDLKTLAEKDAWKNKVQSKLGDDFYVLNCTKKVLTKRES
ncbi:MAG: DUF4825 domain-containing protein [Caulobacteraceae bacterium]